MLAAAGVGLALLVGFSKEASVITATEKILLVASLSFAILTVALVLVSVKVRLSLTVMRNTTLFGGNVPWVWLFQGTLGGKDSDHLTIRKCGRAGGSGFGAAPSA
jgi:hypothetical protein